MSTSRAATAGLFWALVFVSLEAVQFVYFGNIFQRLNAFLFGALVFGVTTLGFLVWAWWTRRTEMRRAFARRDLLWRINLTATLAWIAFLTSVQLIEPAVAYTIGAGAMPITAWIIWRLGLPEGVAMRNARERVGNLVVAVAIVFLAIATVSGLSGFARGGPLSALAGVAFAIADGALFTLLLVYCQRLDRCGVGAGAVFSLRFVLYVPVAGALYAGGIGIVTQVSGLEVAAFVMLGILLIVPPLYALQRAVALVPTLTLSALTATGPFLIFGLQALEGRVEQSGVTLAGLVVYYAGATLAAIGAVKAERALD